MSEITAEKVKALLKSLKSPNISDLTDSYYSLKLMASDIARAYISKCEEVDQVGKYYANELSEADNVTVELFKQQNEVKRLQSIIEKQREALEKIKKYDEENTYDGHCGTVGFIAEESLALTQQQTGGAV